MNSKEASPPVRNGKVDHAEHVPVCPGGPGSIVSIRSSPMNVGVGVTSMDRFLTDHFGAHYDPQLDYIDPLAVARREGHISAELVQIEMMRRLGCVRPFWNGCWTYPKSADRLYSVVAQWIHGPRATSMFGWDSLPADEKDLHSVVIRHHPIRCELFRSLDSGRQRGEKEDDASTDDCPSSPPLDCEHIRCCRPSHLALGSAQQNAMDIGRRRNLEASLAFAQLVKEFVSRTDLLHLILHWLPDTQSFSFALVIFSFLKEND